ncbi:hypothetical protein SynPROSU1_00913 [Synechococcus sp. PROS-U-1]|nr:hypothetical protein SynPROSU1_00913 [Synechococcus sp. PROS-U-1]
MHSFLFIQLKEILFLQLNHGPDLSFLSEKQLLHICCC